jgi:hypothetical protein
VVKREEDDYEFEEYKSKNINTEKTVVNFNKKEPKQIQKSNIKPESSDE